MFKKITSIILATTLVFLMSATAFAQTNNHTNLKMVGQKDTNGYTIVKREIVETFDDGSYILFTEGEKTLAHLALRQNHHLLLWIL